MRKMYLLIIFFVMISPCPAGQFKSPESTEPSNVVISEPVNCAGGTDLLGICALRSQNFSGQNISIAIIDYEYYADRLSERELPKNRIQLFNGTFSEDSRHGTACAEIIGDVAPNVTLYMIGLEESSETGFKEAVDKLLHLNKRIDIVSCSIDFYLRSL